MPVRSASSSFSREKPKRRALRAGGARCNGRLAGIGILGGEHDARKYACEGCERCQLAAFDELREVPLTDVGNLVREHGRELALGLGDDNEPRVHRYDAAGSRERVDGRCVDHEEPVAPARVRARDALPERVDVVDHLGIVDHSKPPPNLPEERFTENLLFSACERLAGCLTEVGKRVVGRGGGSDDERGQQGEDREEGPCRRAHCDHGDHVPSA